MYPFTLFVMRMVMVVFEVVMKVGHFEQEEEVEEVLV